MTNLACFVWFFLSATIAISQKPYVNPFDTSATRWDWPSADNLKISNDGHYVSYIVSDVPAGASSLIVKDLKGMWERSFVISNGSGACFTSDSKYIVVRLSDSLLILPTGGGDSTIITEVASYKSDMPGDVDNRIAYKKRSSNELVVRSLKTGEEHRFANVNDYVFSDNGGLLIVVSKDSVAGEGEQMMQLVNFNMNTQRVIWKGSSAGAYCFDDTERGLAFIAVDKGIQSSLWYYNDSMSKAQCLIEDQTIDIDSNYVLSSAVPFFDKSGGRIFFRLRERDQSPPVSSVPKVDVWSYKDRVLMPTQLSYLGTPRTFMFSMTIRDKKLVRLQCEGEEVALGDMKRLDHIVAYKTADETWLKNSEGSAIYWVSTSDGTRRVIEDRLKLETPLADVRISPSDNWVVYFNGAARSWYSYDAGKGMVRNISKQIPYPVTNSVIYEYNPSLPNVYFSPVGVAAWLGRDSSVLIYDDYDIWLVSLKATVKPINITAGYGRRHFIKFRLVGDGDNTAPTVHFGDTVLLSAFDTQTKFNGFYRLIISEKESPKKLFMGPYVTYVSKSQLQFLSSASESFFAKARYANLWVVTRRCDTLARNYYFTRDFKSYQAVSNLAPHRKFNWLKSELVRYRSLDGDSLSSILFKPENFDPRKKYPVIILYYQQRSDELYDYPGAGWARAEINIPFFVSRGFIVCEPDIRFRIGHPGQSAVSSVVSLTKYLSRFSYIDSKHVGIIGHSFGGFETNYLITHTNIFSAAVEAAGASDYMSAYAGLYGGSDYTGISMQFYYEAGQGRIGATLWQRPDLYLENSPILKADHVTTPLLMMHNKIDGSSSFAQAVEFFTSLRRLNKRVWLLQYDKGVHLVSGDAAKDYTTRVLQFFNHYLKGEPPPIWMTEGVPARERGIMKGLKLDSSNSIP